MKVFVLGDFGISSGYGRIATEIYNRLHIRGVQVFAASVMYDGILQAQMDGHGFPYHVASLRPVQPGQFYNMDGVLGAINAFQPDIIHVIQDFPFAEALRNAPIDWSRFKFVITTPVDGKPIFPPWIEIARKADAMLTISQFGVDAFRQQGVEARLSRPAANLNTFYPMTHDERLAVRAKLGIAPDAFVLGMVAMNQGRKAVTEMVRSFFEFAQDKPTARLILDMEAAGFGGWHIPYFCQTSGYDVSKILFKADCVQRGVTELRERYNVMDVHGVLAYREGFGLPLVESMACGVTTAAMDYSSGTEVVGDGKGILVPKYGRPRVSTWGNALEWSPDEDDFVNQLQHVYEHPEERAAIARRGMEWARQYTWDMAADATMTALTDAMNKRVIVPAPVVTPVPPVQATAPAAAPDGVEKAGIVLQEG